MAPQGFFPFSLLSFSSGSGIIIAAHEKRTREREREREGSGSGHRCGVGAVQIGGGESSRPRTIHLIGFRAAVVANFGLVCRILFGLFLGCFFWLVLPGVCFLRVKAASPSGFRWKSSGFSARRWVSVG